MARGSGSVSSQPLGKDNVCRDVYGFTIRPQHLQRYRQYATIYQEEEAERSARWESFLTRYRELEAGKGNNKENDLSDAVARGGIDAETKLETWAHIRSSLGPIEQALLPRLKKVKSIDTRDDTNESIAEANFSKDGLDEEFKEVPLNDAVPGSEGNDHEEPCLWKEELDTLVHGGVPMALRGEVWQVFVGAERRRIAGHYQALLTLLADGGGDSDGVGGLYKGASNNYSISETGIFEKWTNQIEKDLPRTFPGHPALDEDGRNALRRLLTAYARHNPDVGYCQAMNFFAALLLLMMPEENAFWTLTGFMDDYFEGYYSEKMLESQVDQLVLDELVREYFPRLASHMEALGVQVAWVTGPWFLSIFVNVLPWESVLRVWDVLLYDGNRSMLFRTTLALLEQHGSAIMAARDAGDAVSTLQSLVGSTFDSSQLVLIACMGYENVDEPLLQESRVKNRPKVLAAISERSLWRNSKKSFSLKALPTHGKTNESAKVTTDYDNDVTNEQQMSIPEHLKKTTLTDFMAEDLDDIPNDDIDDAEICVADLLDQIKWLKIELSQALVQRRAANLRAEELETALMELVKEDNRRWLAAKVESLEEEVTQLRTSLAEKEEQEQAMIKAMLKIEQEQQAADAARRYAEDDAATQRNMVNVLQVQYEDTIASLKEMEKRTIMAESMLAATLQYEALGNSPLVQPKATNGDQSRWSWPRFTLKPAESSPLGSEVQLGSAEIADELSVKKDTMTQITDSQKQGFLSRWREK